MKKSSSPPYQTSFGGIAKMKASYFYAFLGQQHFLQAATTKLEWFINPNAKKKRKFRDAGMLKLSASNMYIHVQIVGRSYKQNNWALRWMNLLIYRRNISLATYFFCWSIAHYGTLYVCSFTGQASMKQEQYLCKRWEKMARRKWQYQEYSLLCEYDQEKYLNYEIWFPGSFICLPFNTLLTCSSMNHELIWFPFSLQ